MAFGTKYLAGKLNARTYKAAYGAAMKTAQAGKAGMRGSAQARLKGVRDAAQSAVAMNQRQNLSTARKVVYGGGAIAATSVATASRPNANQSRTSYRGPMQTGRGIGRYS